MVDYYKNRSYNFVLMISLDLMKSSEVRMAGDQSTNLPDLRKGYLCTHPSSEQIYHDVFCTHMSECL